MANRLGKYEKYSSNVNAMIDENDFVAVKKMADGTTNKTDMQKQFKSPRERILAQRKRKAANLSEDGTKKSFSIFDSSVSSTKKLDHGAVATSAVTSMDDEGKLIVEDVIDDKAIEDSIEWPFGVFCDQLLYDLFHPNWENRHGAAIGLRSVLKHHGDGAGRLASTTTAKEDELNHTTWVDDCANRLICILIIDRFADYSSDLAVAPVRETCAQVLGFLMKHSSVETVKRTIARLFVLTTQEQWDLRYGGFIGFKYTVAVRFDVIAQVTDEVFPVLNRGLADSADDVVAVGADCILPILRGLKSNSQIITSADLDRFFPMVVMSLWDCLEQLNDLSVATNAIMKVLSELHAVPCLAKFVDPPELPSHMRIQRLLKLLLHPDSSVRSTSIITIQRLLVAMGTGDANLVHFLGDLIDSLFYLIISDSEDSVIAQAQTLWKVLVGCLFILFFFIIRFYCQLFLLYSSF